LTKSIPVFSAFMLQTVSRVVANIKHCGVIFVSSLGTRNRLKLEVTKPVRKLVILYAPSTYVVNLSLVKLCS